MYTAGESVYKLKFQDKLGVFFDEDTFPGLNEAIEAGDVSEILQDAILKLVKEQQYGILYIPQGQYPIAKTVMVPKAVRLIGYGEKRPTFVLPENAKGFDKEIDLSHFPGWGEDIGAGYMIWFIGNYGPFDPSDRASIMDATPGTFYSTLSNIDFRIEGNHPSAVCIRAHFAQHAFISHCDFDLGTGLAAIYDVGNEMENLTVEGGKYGLLCRMTSPGWPFLLVDCKFHQQGQAAFLTSESGFTGLRLNVSDTPKVFDVWDKNRWEKLYLEDCHFTNISDTVITCTESNNVGQQVNLRNILCENIGALLYQCDTDKVLNPGRNVLVKEYSGGYLFSDTASTPEFTEEYEIIPTDSVRDEWKSKSNIPSLGDMEEWVSLADFGALGDGVSDDTFAIQNALNSGKKIYMPQGIYRITDTLSIEKECSLIGLHPATTQIVILDDEEKFAGFGSPKPLISVLPDVHVVMNGIGVDTASKNPRACGIMWSADETSYMNDVKLMGGHGMMYRDGRNPFATLYNPSRTADYYPDRKWDYQYSSLWINNGGGIFKDIWSCSPYAEAGIAITDTSKACRMYAISLEHHVRHEIKINKVNNLKIYALQTEEEKAEGTECLPMEIVSSTDIEIINYYIFRVVSVDQPYETGIRLWNSSRVRFLNLRNMAQMQYTFTLNLKDENTGFIAKSSDYARLEISGKEAKVARTQVGDYNLLANGFSFAQGACVDKDGNLYWCDKKKKAVFCYDAKEDVVFPLIDIHFTPAAVSFDSLGNMLVAVDYSELKKSGNYNPFDDHDRSDPHPFFSWFYKRGEKAYSIDVNHPFTSIQKLPKVEASAIADLNSRPVIRCLELDYPGRFEEILKRKLDYYYVALDGITLLEGTKDIARATGLTTVKPGEDTVITDDFLRKSYCFAAVGGGNLRNPTLVASRGQYGAFLDENDEYWTIEDKLYRFKAGKLVGSSDIPWDAYTLRLSLDKIYIIGRSSIYAKARD